MFRTFAILPLASGSYIPYLRCLLSSCVLLRRNVSFFCRCPILRSFAMRFLYVRSVALQLVRIYHIFRSVTLLLSYFHSLSRLSVGNLNSLPLFAYSITSGTVIGVAATVTRLIDTMFDISSSSMVTVVGETSMILNGTILETIIYCTNQSPIFLSQSLLLVCNHFTRSAWRNMTMVRCNFSCRGPFYSAVAPSSLACKSFVTLSLCCVAALSVKYGEM